jgi:alpha-amylase/alpha-mannosidase (GH57 family)
MIWANFFHIYQPPRWPKKIITKVAHESYRPVLRILKRHRNLKITLNISGSLTQQLAQYHYLDIIRDIKLLVLKKQIELVGTALYHPILPLLPEKEIIRQIELNTLINKKYFGRAFQPKGFFPPEMCYSQKVANIVAKLRFNWLILDEISAYGVLGKVNYEQAYIIPKSKIQVVFRNRIVSDYLSFHSQIKNPGGFWRAAEQDKRNKKILITAMDGENLGHHRPGLHHFWEKLTSRSGVQTTTISELLDSYEKEKSIVPIPASWSSREKELSKNNPYGLWHDPENPIHYWQWQLINRVINDVNQHKKNPHFQHARHLLDQQLASDQFWWASAKPWWSLDIIQRKTHELLHTASLIDGGQEIKKIVARIIKLSSAWQIEKKFESIARNYLVAEERDNVRFIGGKKITN